MATNTRFQSFVQSVYEKKHDFSSDTIKAALSNVAPNAATNTVFADITEIAAGNGYTAGGSALTLTSSSQTGGTYRAIFQDLTFTAAGGAFATYQYVVFYNDTATNKDLIGYVDIGSPITLNDGESYTVDLDNAQGLFYST